MTLKNHLSVLVFFRQLALGVLIGAVAFSISTVLIIFVAATSVIGVVSSSAQVSASEMISTLAKGWNSTLASQDGQINFLLLGTDELTTRPGEKILTDTIMLMSLQLDSGTLRAVSIPRDLYVIEQNVKINGLYQRGIEEGLITPESKLEQVFSSWTDIPIHHSVVLSMESVAQLIDAIGGVEIDIPESFTDEKYPRGDVDVTVETDPALLYETVIFNQGKEQMNGARALKYMRSRKSLSVSQGSDDARALRQQQVITAVIAKLSDPKLLRQPKVLGQLYGWYDRHIDQYFSLTEAVALVRALGPDILRLEFAPTSLPVRSLSSEGVIYHPREDRVRGWIYLMTSEAEFRAYIRTALDFP